MLFFRHRQRPCAGIVPLALAGLCLVLLLAPQVPAEASPQREIPFFPAAVAAFPALQDSLFPAADIGLPVFFAGTGYGLSDTVFHGFQAMGGREAAALEPDGGGQSPMEQYFGGSFLGALLFGFPYTGVGMADIVVLLALAYLALRAVLGKRTNEGSDRLSGNRRDDFSARNSDERPWTDPEDSEKERENPSRRNGRTRSRDAPYSPGDTAWSRRLRGRRENSDDTEDRASTPDRDLGRTEAGRQVRGPLPPQTVKKRAEAMWAHLRSNPESGAAGFGASEKVAGGAYVPAGFDTEDFLEGARTLYIRLQNAWAGRNVDDLAPFTTGDMLHLLREQAARNPTPEPVEIVLVNATLLDVVQKGGAEEALVRFESVMRMGEAENPSEITELWRFTRGDESHGMWRLGGIEQE
jgi:predicted lipid-binding transport protein (Tim44 family)